MKGSLEFRKTAFFAIYMISFLYFCSMVRGRSKQLIALRDEAIIRRYYHLTEVDRLRFDDALTLLSQREFYISEARIMAIIRANCHKFKDIKVSPVPKVRMPRIKKTDLDLFK